MSTLLAAVEVARELYTYMQGDVSEGTLTPVELPQEDTSDGRALSGAEAGASGTASWGEDLRVCHQALLWSLMSHTMLPR